MRIWLVAVTEPVPVGAGRADRPHRAGAFAEYAAAMGHDVVWWTSTFDHFRKQQLFSSDAVLQVQPNLQIRFLRGFGYRKNVSLARIADHARIAAKFAQEARRQRARPDVVLAQLPPVELARKCAEYGCEQNVPVVVDMLDMWPDIFPEALPRQVRWLARVALRPMAASARAASARATAILGMTQEFVEWGLRKAGRSRSRWDRVFPLTCDPQPPLAAARAVADQFWDEQGISGAEFAACFVGSLGRQFDVATIIAAGKLLRRRGVAARLVICGAGENLETHRSMAAGADNVLLPGWIDRAQSRSLFARCQAGIDPLPDRFDYLASINNKAVDYLSAGLPVLSSPNRGVLCDFLRTHECGLSYATGDSAGLANAVEKLVADPPLLCRLSTNARHTFSREFEPGVVHGGLLQYLQELVEAHQRNELGRKDGFCAVSAAAAGN